MGVVTPAGSTLDTFWSTLCSGRSLAAPLTCIEASDLPVRFGCEVRDYDPMVLLGPKDVRRMDRVSHLAMAAGLAAVVDAELGEMDTARAGVIVGTGIGGMRTHEDAVLAMANVESRRRMPLAIPMIMANASAAYLAIRTGWTGPNLSISTACASGAHAIGEAARLIREGSAVVMLAGGAEAPLTPFAIRGFDYLQALSQGNDDPATASRPFDKARDGFVLSEGAAFVVLEESRHARDRGALVWGHLSGYGRNCDASSIVMPQEDGRGAIDCMRLALAAAGAGIEDVVYVNAHGTSTLLNDRSEAGAIEHLFGTRSPPVTSLKGSIGHSLGASGAIQLVATCLSLAARRIPPTANFMESEAEIRLNVVSGSPLDFIADGGIVLSNSFAFGGHNACLAVRGATEPWLQRSALSFATR